MSWKIRKFSTASFRCFLASDQASWLCIDDQYSCNEGLFIIFFYFSPSPFFYKKKIHATDYSFFNSSRIRRGHQHCHRRFLCFKPKSKRLQWQNDFISHYKCSATVWSIFVRACGSNTTDTHSYHIVKWYIFENHFLPENWMFTHLAPYTAHSFEAAQFDGI